VCPTGASRQRDDGIVWVEYSVCIGCGCCAMACPYHARHLILDDHGYFPSPTPAEAAQAQLGRTGVMTKCTFCKERVDDGLARGLTVGVDPEATPMCAVACIADVISFGDLDDASSAVSRMVAGGGFEPLMPETGLDPRVYYRVE
jgi:phenylacetyl-CoA:acceptor oxidoreductase subunit 1